MQNHTTATACDYCGARAGDRCVTATGRPATRPHAARTAAPAPAVETVTPLREAIASGIQQRGITTFRPAGLTATIEVYTPDQSPDLEATIHYEGETLTGYPNDIWGYIERESWVVETTWAEAADGLLDALAALLKEHWEVTLIEIPERIARDLAATIEDVDVTPSPEANAPAVEIVAVGDAEPVARSPRLPEEDYTLPAKHLAEAALARRERLDLLSSPVIPGRAATAAQRRYKRAMAAYMASATRAAHSDLHHLRMKAEAGDLDGLRAERESLRDAGLLPPRDA